MSLFHEELDNNKWNPEYYKLYQKPSLRTRAKTSLQRLVTKTKSTLSVVALSALMAASFVPSAFAKGSTNQPKPTQPVKGKQETAKQPTSSKSSTTNDKKKVQVEIVIEKKKNNKFTELLTKDNLNNVGRTLVAVLAVYFAYVDNDQDDEVSKKDKSTSAFDSDDEDNIITKQELKFKKKLEQEKRNRFKPSNGASLPPLDELFEDDESMEDIVDSVRYRDKTFSNSISTRKGALPTSSNSARDISKKLVGQTHDAKHRESAVTELDKDRDGIETISKPTISSSASTIPTSQSVQPKEEPVEVSPFATLMTFPEIEPESIAQPSLVPPTAINTMEAPVESKKPGLLGRLFQKSASSSRPIDLKSALKASDNSATYRIAILAYLRNHLPKKIKKSMDEIIGDVDDNIIVEFEGLDDDSSANKLQTIYLDADINIQQAAEIFAEITNAVVVLLVDRAVDTADDTDEEITIKAMEKIGHFVDNIGTVFSKVVSNVRIEPIQYNGKSKKNKIETIFTRYAKYCLDSTIPRTEDNQTEEELQMIIQQQSEELERRNARLGKLQYILGITESKRSSIEQKIFREKLMSMTGDGNDGNKGLGGGLLDMVTGKVADKMLGGLGGMNNMNMNDMNGMPNIDPNMLKELEQMMGGNGGGKGGIPDVNPEEAMESVRTLVYVKISIYIVIYLRFCR
jgi:hypothetical protein